MELSFRKIEFVFETRFGMVSLVHEYKKQQKIQNKIINFSFHNKFTTFAVQKFHLKGGHKTWKKTQFHKYKPQHQHMMTLTGALTNAM